MRYSGKIGWSDQTEVRPGVWEETITERTALGTVEQRTEAFVQGDSINPTYRTTTSVSVPCGGAEKQDYSDLRYLTYMGRRWVPSSVVLQWPRLIIYIGEEYHGPIPGAAGSGTP